MVCFTGMITMQECWYLSLCSVADGSKKSVGGKFLYVEINTILVPGSVGPQYKSNSVFFWIILNQILPCQISLGIKHSYGKISSIDEEIWLFNQLRRTDSLTLAPSGPPESGRSVCPPPMGKKDSGKKSWFCDVSTVYQRPSSEQKQRPNFGDCINSLWPYCWEVPGEITDRNAAEVDANLYRWWGSYTHAHGQRCWYIELCVVWDRKRAGPWWIGHHAPKSRVFSSKRRRDDLEIGVNRQSDGRSENSVLLFKISSFRKGDVCDIY
jgi:hypothetical protein